MEGGFTSPHPSFTSPLPVARDPDRCFRLQSSRKRVFGFSSTLAALVRCETPHENGGAAVFQPSAIIRAANDGSRRQQLHGSTPAGRGGEQDAEEGGEVRQMAGFIGARWGREVRPRGWSSLIRETKKKQEEAPNTSLSTPVGVDSALLLCYHKIFRFVLLELSQSALSLRNHCPLACSGHVHLFLAPPTAPPPSSVHPPHQLAGPPSRHQHVDL